jgi:hypothetical protein
MVPPVPRRHDDRGTSLILAIVFVFVVGVVLVAVGGLSANALLNTNNNRSQRTASVDAENAVTIAMQYLRYNYVPPTTSSCLPSGTNIPSSDPRATGANPLTVYCSQNISPINTPTRTVDFFACSSTVTATQCTSPNGPRLLYAHVTYNDLNPQGIDACNLTTNGTPDSSCGLAMNVQIWDVAGADS